MSSKATFRTKKTTTQWVRNNIDLILELPKPGQEFRFEDLIRQSEKFETVRNDLSSDFRNTFSTLRNKGVIKRKEYHYNKIKSYGYHHWITSKEIYQYAEQTREQRDTYPCDHSAGFRTIDPDANIYECGYELCDETFGRSVVEAVQF